MVRRRLRRVIGHERHLLGAMLLHETFELAGLTLPWDEAVRRPIPRDMRPSMAAVVRNRLGWRR